MNASLPKRTLGWQVIDWIEHYLVHGPGDVQGEEVEFDDELAAFVVKCYELRPDGRRKKRRAFLSRPKGRAKSELAGMLACAEAVAPVRFDHWAIKGEESPWGYVYEKGEPVGRAVTAPEVLCIATEEGQADNTYGNVQFMLEHLAENHGRDYPGIDPGMTRCFVGGGGEITPVTAKARSKDGGKSSFVVFDETHLYETSELRTLHATVRRNLGKRKIAEPWSLETSTMYRPGANSVAQATHEYAKSIEKGKRRDEGLLFDHREAPIDFDWDSDVELRKALTEVYGPASEWMDFDRLIEEIRDPQADEADSRRYWLNQVVAATEQAFDPIRWAELADPAFVVADRELITLGFKGARFRESTALIATHVESGHQWPIEIWERPDNLDPERQYPSNSDVENAVAMTFDRWNVWRLYAEPTGWETVIDELSARFDTKKDKRVVPWWWNGGFRRKAARALRVYASSQKAGELSHDGSSVFAKHIANARRQDTQMRDEDDMTPLWMIQRENAGEDKSIAAAYAGCLSWEARGDAIASRAEQKSKGGVIW